MTEFCFQRLIAHPVESLIKNELRCPKCRDPMHPPIHHCEKGHSYCNLCYKSDYDCMLCGSKCSGGRTHHLERIVTLFSYPCKYFNKGCRRTCKIQNLRAHEKGCQTFKIKCPFGLLDDCLYIGNRQQTVFHCQLTHTSKTFVGNEKLRFCPSKLFVEKITNIQEIMEKNRLLQNEDTLYQSIYVLCLDDIIFVVMCYFNLKNIKILTYRITSPYELSDEYEFVITFFPGNGTDDKQVLREKCENIGDSEYSDSLEFNKKNVIIDFNLLKSCQYFDVKFEKKT